MNLRLWLVVAVLSSMLGCGGGKSGGSAGTGGGATADGVSGVGGNSGVDAGNRGTSGVGGGVGGASSAGKGGASGAARGGASGVGAGAGGASAGGTSASGGTGGAPRAACEDALVPADKCAVCAMNTTCDAPTYTDNHDGTVTSSCCMLVWQQEVDTSRDYDWAGATAYCANLALVGGGWRVPTKDELLSLVVRGATPTIDKKAFPNATERVFWTSTTDARSGSNRKWTVDFQAGGGYADGDLVSSGNLIRCVR